MYQPTQYRSFFNMMRAPATGGPHAYTYAEQEVSLKALASMCFLSLKALASFGPTRARSESVSAECLFQCMCFICPEIGSDTSRRASRTPHAHTLSRSCLHGQTDTEQEDASSEVLTCFTTLLVQTCLLTGTKVQKLTPDEHQDTFLLSFFAFQRAKEHWEEHDRQEAAAAAAQPS
jgi:hypothetical protein